MASALHRPSRNMEFYLSINMEIFPNGANLQLLSTLETTLDEQWPLFGCSRDTKKAFDSVSKPLILLCRQRLGVFLAIAQWLVDLNDAGDTIVRTLFAHKLKFQYDFNSTFERLDVQGLDGVQSFAFNPERGTCHSQGDIHSPFTWLAVLDMLLTMLENTPTPDHHFHLRRPDGSYYKARDIRFADDLQTFSSTLEGLQRTADLGSTYAMVVNLTIASHKLRAFHYRVRVYDPGRIPSPIAHLRAWVSNIRKTRVTRPPLLL